MLQYLLNLTGIWLLSLAVFDLFLKRESFHSYNRLYLLTTMVVGIIFPLIKWQPTKTLFTAVEKPMGTIIAAKGNIVAAAETSNSVSWEQWLMVLYVAGATVVTGLLVRDIVKLVHYYRSGSITSIVGWTLIETGNAHAPFSFMNLLFVSSREDYDDAEWRMLVEHEGRHTSLVHVADLLLLQVTRIVFWFHPLAYVYNKRLLMVHEYQADKVAGQQTVVYGRFLAEQAVLHAAPSMTHSFNRSPIKKRIVMLTQKSSVIAKGKMVLVLPLTVACLVLFSQVSYSKRFERKGNTITYRGNRFEVGSGQLDTVVLLDPVTGKEVTTMTKRDPLPETINGKRIYKLNEVSVQPQTYSQNGSITDYVFRKMSGLLNELPDGTFRLDINNIVISEKGKIVYYEGIGLSRVSNPDVYKMQKTIEDKIDEVLNGVPPMKPGSFYGTDVAVLSDISFMNYEIEVKNHQSSIKQVWK